MYQRILAAYDGSTNSKQALLEAIRLAKEQHAQLRVVHVLEERPWQIYCNTLATINVGTIEDLWEQAGKDILADAARQAHAAGIEAETQLVETLAKPPALAILDAVWHWHPDLIVMGTHGRHGVERMFLGSVAEGVVRAAEVPVLLIHDKVCK